jgi:hypothetical protein
VAFENTHTTKGETMKTKNSVKVSVFGIGLAALSFLATTAGTQAQVECITNNIKYVQQPDPAGYDVSDGLGYVLADDFVCRNTGPITDIHIWGSWLSDVHGAITNFVLAIYDDVPATTNAAGQVTPSHPGNMLWTEQFLPGQFSENPVGPSQETFISPASVNAVGTDTQIWFYCFNPKNPFTQTGAVTAPITYWLAAYAEGQNFGPIFNEPPQYGWKTTPRVQHDASVNTLWTGAMPPAGAPWKVTTTPANSPVGPVPLDLAFMLGTIPGAPCCPDTDTVKYQQPPDLVNGIDVDATSVRGGVLADDFPCTQMGPITDIHIWGSWLDDRVDLNATFILSIWSDIPGIPTTGQPSHPGNLLWTQSFGPGQYVLCPFTNVPEAFDDPNYNPPIPPILNPFGASTNLYYLCFNAFPTNVFYQMGGPNSPTNYWLSVEDISGPGPVPLYFGWKTSSLHYNDAAVASLNVPYPPPGAWKSLSGPNGNVDFSFKIDTQIPTVECMETDGVKNIQLPNTMNGFDVWNAQDVLADDFICTNPGAITDIHLWGSWLNDNAATNTITFWLGLYDNVPPGTGTNNFSYPGTNLLWQQWFAPGQYAETIWTSNATEQFYDPSQNGILGPDSVVWYFCFNPTNPFVQSGTLETNKTYWLAAYAQFPIGVANDYGWKTSSNVLNDISVHAPWPGGPPTANPGWTPTIYQPPTGGPKMPLDLSFKLTTPTNCAGPISIKYYSTNIVVVTWQTGILQVSTNLLNDTFKDVPGASSPYTNIAVNPPFPPIRFYRLRCN